MRVAGLLVASVALAAGGATASARPPAVKQARSAHVLMKLPVRRAHRLFAPGGAVVAGGAVAALSGPPAPVVAPAAAIASTVGADAFDLGSFVLRLTRPAVPAGTLTIYFHNRDVGDHNLWIDGPGLAAPLQVSGAVGENGTATKRLAVGAGAWRLYCSLPGHEAMSATLTVG